MKISATPQFHPDPPVARSHRATEAATTDFQSILTHTLDRLADSQQPGAVSRPFAASSARPLAMPTTDPVLSLTDRLDRLVDRLDSYRQKLADPQATLRSIEPLVNDIAALARKLAPELNSADQTGPLGDILRHALVTASAEITRFNRGEYV